MTSLMLIVLPIVMKMLEGYLPLTLKRQVGPFDPYPYGFFEKVIFSRGGEALLFCGFLYYHKFRTSRSQMLFEIGLFFVVFTRKQLRLSLC